MKQRKSSVERDQFWGGDMKSLSLDLNMVQVPRTKEHQISMGALPIELRNEAEEVERRTRSVLGRRYEKPIVGFEHGPSAENHGTGCGVDHAHLHLLPLDCDLLTYVRPFVPTSVEWKACDWEDLAKAHAAGLDYLYFRPAGQNGLMVAFPVARRHG